MFCIPKIIDSPSYSGSRELQEIERKRERVLPLGLLGDFYKWIQQSDGVPSMRCAAQPAMDTTCPGASASAQLKGVRGHRIEAQEFSEYWVQGVRHCQMIPRVWEIFVALVNG